MMTLIRENATSAFVLGVLTLSSLICFVAAQLNDSNFAILSVLTPSLVALVIVSMTEGKKGLKGLFVTQLTKRIGLGWLLLSLVGIPVIAGIAIVLDARFDTNALALRTTQLLPQMVVIVLIAFGEEFGWRGFLLPRLLQSFGFVHASLFSGLVWGIWHFPAYLIGTGVPQQMNFIIFLIWVLLASVFMSWVYTITRSVLSAILIHISANAAFNYFYLLPEFTGSMNRFWLFLLILAIISGIIVVKFKKAAGN